jgi:hypothetical protein
MIYAQDLLTNFEKNSINKDSTHAADHLEVEKYLKGRRAREILPTTFSYFLSFHKSLSFLLSTFQNTAAATRSREPEFLNFKESIPYK